MCAAAVINSNKSIGVLMWERETVQGIRMVMYACSQFGGMKAVSKIPIILSCSSILITKNYIINSTIFHRQMTNSVMMGLRSVSFTNVQYEFTKTIQANTCQLVTKCTAGINKLTAFLLQSLTSQYLLAPIRFSGYNQKIPRIHVSQTYVFICDILTKQPNLR